MHDPNADMTRQREDRSRHVHRQFIGILGMLMPILLVVVERSRPTGGLPLTSVSAFYHSGAIVVFVGALCALGAFFFTYQGYDNPDGRWDRRVAFVAGVAATCVAFFPTGIDEFNPEWWQDAMGVAHYVSAIVLFGSFIVFSLFLFPKSSLPKDVQPRAKRVRNGIYRFCGFAMVANVGWIAIAKLLDADAPIFWPEVFALELFALSWLVKGRADQAAVAAVTGTVHYVTHPQQIPSAAWAVIVGRAQAPARSGTKD